MKILVVGKDGMAGHVITKTLQNISNFTVLTTSRSDEPTNDFHFKYDVFNKDEIVTVLSDYTPDYVINCIGILVSHSQTNPDEAIYVNSYFPHYLDRLSDKYKFKLIHISTDCVFSGKKGSYIESDLPDETNFYGRSKALGEVVNKRNLTIRTSIIGPELKSNGVGLFHWFMNQTGDVYGYTKALWSGVTTIELAKFILYVISQKVELSGLHHLVNNDSISKKDLLGLFSESFNLNNINILSDDEFISDKTILCTINKNLYQVPRYVDMIDEMHQWVCLENNSFKNYDNYLIT